MILATLVTPPGSGKNSVDGGAGLCPLVGDSPVLAASVISGLVADFALDRLVKLCQERKGTWLDDYRFPRIGVPFQEDGD